SIGGRRLVHAEFDGHLHTHTSDLEETREIRSMGDLRRSIGKRKDTAFLSTLSVMNTPLAA
ncbi:hypothetical protein PENTCL1PPCAC_23064, partial [Pristionchus entomophagus]